MGERGWSQWLRPLFTPRSPAAIGDRECGSYCSDSLRSAKINSTIALARVCVRALNEGVSAGPTNLSSALVVDGKWRIERVLGAGGMGTVYRAQHVRNGRDVALKILHREVAADADARERFLREGYAANHVGHPGTVQVLDDGTSAEGTYLVMELLEGAAINELAEANDEVLPLPHVLAITDAALAVLAVAHAKGIVHRDLKPENLFLTRNGQLRVLDFGLARVREAPGAARLTTTGVVMGTPAFMPPEQALARWNEVDATSDVFSMGASMWTLLTGRLIHEAATSGELLVKAATGSVSSIASVYPNIPVEVARVIDRSLSFERGHRFADAGQMRLALHAAVVSSGLTLPPLASLSSSGAEHHGPSLNPMDSTTPTEPAVGASERRPLGSVAPLTADSQRGRRMSRSKLATLLALAAVIGVLAGAIVYVQRPEHAESASSASPTPHSVEPPVPASSSQPTTRSSTTVAQTLPSAAASAVTSTVSSSAPQGGKARKNSTVSVQPTTAITSKPCDVINDYGCKR